MVSAAGPDIAAPVAALIARFPPVWSGCQWGVPDLGDSPAAPLRLRERRRGVARVDHRSLAAVFVADQPDVIVGERGNRDDLEHH